MNRSIRMYKEGQIWLPWPCEGRLATLQRCSHGVLTNKGPQGKGLAPGGRSRQIIIFLDIL